MKSAIYKFNRAAKTFSAETPEGVVTMFKTGKRAIRAMKKAQKKEIILIKK
jgi:hypothetical protein